MSNAPRPAEFRPEVAEIRETRCREEKYSSGEKNSKLGHFCAKYEASKKSWNREEKNMATNAEWMIQRSKRHSS